MYTYLLLGLLTGNLCHKISMVSAMPNSLDFSSLLCFSSISALTLPTLCLCFCFCFFLFFPSSVRYLILLCRDRIRDLLCLSVKQMLRGPMTHCQRASIGYGFLNVNKKSPITLFSTSSWHLYLNRGWRLA